MIIKNKGWVYAGFKRLASYIFLGAVAEGEVQPKQSSLIWHNMAEGLIPENVAKEMMTLHENRKYSGKKYKALNHTILSWSPKEDKAVLTDEVMCHLAQQYIQERCPDAKVFGAIHKEAEHYHVHLLFCNTLPSGQSMRISQADFEACKQRVYAYQREYFPELKHSYETEGFQEKRKAEEYDGSITKDKRYLYELYKRKEDRLHEHRERLSELIRKDYSSALHFLRACRAAGYEEYSRKKEGLFGFVIDKKKRAYSSLFLDKDDRAKFKKYRRALKRMNLEQMVAAEQIAFQEGMDIDKEEQGFEWEF